MIASPALPLFFLRKIVCNVLADPDCASHLLRASGWLICSLGGWAWGEALGFLDALRRMEPA